MKTGMDGCRTAKLVAEMRVRDCTAPSTLPAEKRPFMSLRVARSHGWARGLCVRRDKTH